MISLLRVLLFTPPVIVTENINSRQDPYIVGNSPPMLSISSLICFIKFCPKLPLSHYGHNRPRSRSKEVGSQAYNSPRKPTRATPDEFTWVPCYHPGHAVHDKPLAPRCPPWYRKAGQTCWEDVCKVGRESSTPIIWPFRSRIVASSYLPLKTQIDPVSWRRLTCRSLELLGGRMRRMRR